MEKKRNFKSISIMALVFVLLCLMAYKFAMLQKYKTENIAINTTSIFNETVNIGYTEDDVITFDEMSYKDYFADYVDKEGLSFKVKYNENGEISAFYSIIKEKQLINLLNVNSFELATDGEDSKNDFSTEKDMKKFLNNNNIKDDIDLIKYIKDNYYLENKLLTPTKTMRKNYIINSLAQSVFPNFESITLIKSDNIKGYIVNVHSSPLKSIHLLYGDNQYVIALFGEEVTNSEFINNLLETVSFN